MKVLENCAHTKVERVDDDSLYEGNQMTVYGKYTYTNIGHMADGGLYVETVIFGRCFRNVLPELPHVNAMELTGDGKTWEGEYDDIIGSRADICRSVPPKRKAEALDILLKCPDLFAEWVDVNGEAG